MLSFLRRRPGRGGALGAAVTAIPSAPVQPVGAAFTDVPTPTPAEAVVPAPAPAAPAAVAPAASGPRVELSFRDGSSASLHPASEAAQALEELARMLTRGH